MTVLVVLTVIVIVALIAGLAFYLYWAGTLLDRIGAKLEGAAELVRGIVADAELIGPGVEHINQTGAVVASPFAYFETMAWPFWAARWSAVRSCPWSGPPNVLRALTSALFARRNSATSLRPFSAASCNGE